MIRVAAILIHNMVSDQELAGADAPPLARRAGSVAEVGSGV